MTQFIQRYSNTFVSKWLILILDVIICGVAFAIASVLRFNFDFKYIDPTLFKFHLLVVLYVKTAVFLYLKSYTGIIRHTGIEDAKILIKSGLFSVAILSALSYFLGNQFNFLQIPISILLIDFFITSFILIASRFIVKSVYDTLKKDFKSNVSVIIYGAGHLGLNVKNTLLKDKARKFEILCFIDDNPQKIAKTIEGIPVLSKKQATKKYIEVDERPHNLEVIFAIQEIGSQKKKKIINEFLENKLVVKSVPPVNSWISGELSITQIQNIKIEDLLEREPISINNKLVRSFIENKVVLITGAAGSIGSEIVRQISIFKPKKLVLIDQAESAIYDIETELIRLHKVTNQRCEVINICNKNQLERIFIEERPDIVFHAAAYKHVPLMEKNPYNAVLVNVIGTKIVADLASKYEVSKFVMISTDKAVNPTNVMGASKRMAEVYVHSLNTHHTNNTRFIITRFGNVLGSNGSVIPLFKKQIESGGPITVTHPEIIRYFMTIPEACQLVLEAGTMGKGGEVFVFDMGEPVKIVDLAEKMVQLSGLELGKDISIEFTGLRPGEKLFEELLNDNENTIPTYHSKIMIAKVMPVDYDSISKEFDDLLHSLNKTNNTDIVKFMKRIVPEYISNNSVYSDLDTLLEESSSYAEATT